MHKERLKANDEEYITVIGDVKDKTCIIVDDICDTAETLMIVAKVLKEKGAKDIYAYVTHGVLVD
jgi:ribose-phosphate pyrophosphokinase